MEKVLKVLAEWPLSKVELVEIDGNKFVRKTIHKDFVNEYHRQKFLEQNLKWTKVPHLYEPEELKNETVSFLMDYVYVSRELTDWEAVELLMDFQGESRNLKDKSFPVYDMNALNKDAATAKAYGINIETDDFDFIARHEPAIVHGDFGTDQMVIDKNNDLYLLDFGKSFYGPPILDIAYFCRKNKEREKLAIKMFKKDDFVKAKIVVGIMQIAWFHLCKAKYIKDHDYGEEIAAEAALINSAMKS